MTYHTVCSPGLTTGNNATKTSTSYRFLQWLVFIFLSWTMTILKLLTFLKAKNHLLVMDTQKFKLSCNLEKNTYFCASLQCSSHMTFSHTNLTVIKRCFSSYIFPAIWTENLSMAWKYFEGQPQYFDKKISFYRNIECQNDICDEGLN